MRNVDRLSPESQLEICRQAEALMARGMPEKMIATTMRRSHVTIRLAVAREPAHGSCRECEAEIVQWVRVTDRRRYHRCEVCAEKAWRAEAARGI